MARMTKIIGVTLYPQQIQYLNELNNEGYNRSAVIRKALDLYKNSKRGQQVDCKGGLNEKHE